jgi:hypothetical protein
MRHSKNLMRKIALTGVALLVAGCMGTGADYDNILIGDAVGRYEPNQRNITADNAFSLVELEGRTAGRFSLSLDDGGHPGDWQRNGRPGYGQRVEFGEPPARSQRLGRDYWTHASIYIPRGTTSRDQTSLMNWKEVIGNGTRGSLHTLGIRRDSGVVSLKFNHVMNEPWRCVDMIDAAGEGNSACEGNDVSVIMGPIGRFTGRWLDVVTMANWANDGTGEFHMWIDGRKMMGLTGNTSQDAEAIQFKFGAYRIGLNEGPSPREMTVYYSDVGSAGECETVVASRCTQYEAERSVMGYPGAQTAYTYTGNGNAIAELVAQGWRIGRR